MRHRIGGFEVPKGVPGAARLREALCGAPMSELELRFRRRLREAGLPQADHINRVTGTFLVDCRWLKQRVTVELDSFRFHNSRLAFERDRRREREAYARGDQFRRYTWYDVAEDPRAMLAELAAILG